MKTIWNRIKKKLAPAYLAWYKYKYKLPEEIKAQLDARTINLGGALRRDGNIKLKELTFIPGGSLVLDYAFIRKIVEIFECKKYLEIGTYIGESINILTDICDKLYSITAPADAPFSPSNAAKRLNIPDYGNRLCYASNIEHYYTDSKKFDFEVLPKDIDIFFIDGDHSYAGVFSDTKNIFKIKKEDAIVIWHDFKTSGNKYRDDVIRAVADALGDEFKRVYVTDNNLCGIYLPDKFKDAFELKKVQYEVNAPLYVYNVSIEVDVNMAGKQ